MYMSPEKRTYRQVERMVATNSTARNLATTIITNTTSTDTQTDTVITEREEEVNRTTLYKTLVLLSQVGGFAYFLKAVFGTIVGVFMHNSITASLINRIKFHRIKKDAKMRSKIESLYIPQSPQQVEEESKQLNSPNLPPLEPAGSFEKMKNEISEKMSNYYYNI